MRIVDVGRVEVAAQFAHVVKRLLVLVWSACGEGQTATACYAAGFKDRRDRLRPIGRLGEGKGVLDDSHDTVVTGSDGAPVPVCVRLVFAVFCATTS